MGRGENTLAGLGATALRAETSSQIPLAIQTHHPREISEELARQCSSLTLRNEGEMAATLRMIRAGDSEGKLFTHFDPEDPQKLAGWALASENRYGAGWQAQIYVRRSHRRQGIGSALLTQLNEACEGEVGVTAEDELSGAFYAAVVDRDLAKNYIDGYHAPEWDDEDE